MVGFHVGYRQKSRNVAKKIVKNGLARRNLLEIVPIILLEVVMVPNRVGIFPTIDINKDGRPDAVLFRTSDTLMKARDNKGRKITVSEQSSEMRPVLAGESTGIYAPFHTQDTCKVDEDFARIKAGTYKDHGIFWRYASADIPFAATIGGTPFHVGQTVMLKGQAKPQVIEAFRVGLQVTWGQGAPVIRFGAVEAMVAGCRAVALDQVVPSKK